MIINKFKFKHSTINLSAHNAFYSLEFDCGVLIQHKCTSYEAFNILEEEVRILSKLSSDETKVYILLKERHRTAKELGDRLGKTPAHIEAIFSRLRKKECR